MLFLDIVVCGCSSREGFNRCLRGLDIVVVEKRKQVSKAVETDWYSMVRTLHPDAV